VQPLLGEPHRAGVDRQHRLGEGELGRTPADVDHQERATGRIEAGRGAEVGEPALLGAGEQLGPHAEDRPGGVEELVAVRRVAGGGRGDGTNPLRALRPQDGGVVVQDLQRARHRLVVEATRAVDPAAQPGDRGPPLVTHQQARRVGPDVDGARDHRCTSGRCSATHAPTGSSPPARNQA
jgi:hypothetical protein